MAKIGVDIGHGVNTFPPSKGVYKDGVGYHEHVFNAKVGMRVKELLEAAGHTVYMAQPPLGVDKGLNARIREYNGQKLDFILCIHANAAGSKDANGLCAFYWQDSKESEKLASLYAKLIKEYGYKPYSGGKYPSRRNHWSNFAMLRDTNAPTILTENGFMTNPDDFQNIFKSDKYIEDLAQIHAKIAAEYTGKSYKDTDGKKPVVVKIPAPAVSPAIEVKPNNKKTSQGVSSTTKDIQKFLNEEYKAKLSVDGYDGPKTRKALVKALQTELNKQFGAGLSVDGIWGPKTAAAIVTVKEGAKGNLTYILQAALYLDGYDTAGVDGIFGQGTSKAVKAFQKAKKLSVDGKAGTNTFKALFA